MWSLRITEEIYCNLYQLEVRQVDLPSESFQLVVYDVMRFV
jgi:hypothetical protein